MALEFQELWQQGPPAIVGISSTDFLHRVDELQKDLPPAPNIVLVSSSEPIDFLAAFFAALLNGNTIALANPAWQQKEWASVVQQLSTIELDLAITDRVLPTAAILIPTGGTTGQPRFVVHVWKTLAASAQGFLAHFNVDKANAYCVLPLYHVSGLMQVMRSWISGGQIAIQPFQALKEGLHLVEPDANWFISFVPTQLQRLLKANQAEWLQGFRAILLGGAPAWPSLLDAAAGLPISLTYGMSETAAQVATLKPEDFTAGNRSSGPVLPHAQIEIVSPTGKVLPVGSVGQLRIRAKSLAVGYWGEPAFGDVFYPDDMGYLDQAGHLHILGRNSQKIITGGENVFPTEVEAVLRATGQVEDICILGTPDEQWGQAVTAVYVPVSASVTPTLLKQSLAGQLSAYKHPKRWIAVPALPRNAQGKLNRQQVVDLIAEPSGTLSTDSANA